MYKLKLSILQSSIINVLIYIYTNEPFVFIDQRGRETGDGVGDIFARQKTECVQYCEITRAYYPLRVDNRIPFSFNKYCPDYSAKRGRSWMHVIFGDVNTKRLNNVVSHQVRRRSLKRDASYGDAAQAGRYDAHAYVDRRDQPEGE